MKPRDVGLPEKKCTVCLKRKPLSAFGVHRHAKGGKRPWCKLCHAERMREYKRNMTPEQKARYKKVDATSRAARMGLTLTEYRRMLRQPCAICGRLIKKAKPGHGMHVDHCHQTGVVRGTLCTTCNKGLGLFYDRPDLLTAAADYLVENGAPI